MLNCDTLDVHVFCYNNNLQAFPMSLIKCSSLYISLKKKWQLISHSTRATEKRIDAVPANAYLLALQESMEGVLFLIQYRVAMRVLYLQNAVWDRFCYSYSCMARCVSWTPLLQRIHNNPALYSQYHNYIAIHSCKVRQSLKRQFVIKSVARKQQYSFQIATGESSHCPCSSFSCIQQ